MTLTNETGSKHMGFKGLRIVSFESRQSDLVRQNIERRGGRALCAPSLQEVPLTRNPEALAFADALLAGKVDMLLLMTGVGTRMMMDVMATKHDRSLLIQALKKIPITARGPKPVQALKELGLVPAITVPEPNTWREMIEMLDTHEKSIPLKGACVAIQEYGTSNDELIQVLKKREARVIQVPVYRWALPDDTAPLKSAIQEIVNESVDVAIFTSAIQMTHLLRVAAEIGLETELKRGLKTRVIASIGPTTSEALQSRGIPVDFEPSHPKLGTLMAELADQAGRLLETKAAPSISIIGERLKAGTRDDPSRRAESPFLKACRLEPAAHTPIWLMRQAGRYMKEYRALRSRVSFMDLCKTPELAAEVTVHAAETLGVDAAIIFSDILLILEPMGLHLAYGASGGPEISKNTEMQQNIDRLGEIRIESLDFVYEAIRLTRKTLKPDLPLIGFSGAPFTLASYIIEAGSSKHFLATKKLMYNEPQIWHRLMEKLARGIAAYVNAQADAGADAIQLFDSWVGCLSPEDYRRYVLPHAAAVIQGIKPGVPVIHFGTGTGPFLQDMREAGGQVIGADFRIRLDEAWAKIGYDRGIQGNLDPVALFSPMEEIKLRVQDILKQAGGRPGHIFNLGHGILPGTPVDHVKFLVHTVHEMSETK